jgi:hypothetical protein
VYRAQNHKYAALEKGFSGEVGFFGKIPYSFEFVGIKKSGANLPICKQII